MAKRVWCAPVELSRNPKTWSRLLAARGLLDAVHELREPPAPADLLRLRAKHEPELVPLAIELTRARRKAMQKWPRGDEFFCDIQGVEQASGHEAATWKARRFQKKDLILDLCCGIGGDSLSLAEAGRVQAVDRDPLRIEMTRHNSKLFGIELETSTQDVEELQLSEAWVHLDPQRRHGRRRAQSYDEYQPGPDFIERVARKAKGAAIKLGPGVELDALPFPKDTELEMLADSRGLLQAVLWTGDLAHSRGQRRASDLRTEQSFVGTTEEDAPFVDAPMRFIHVPHPAIDRLRLTGSCSAGTAMAEFCPGLGYLTSDAPSDSAWFRDFEVHAAMPWRIPKLRNWLSAHDAGTIIVKTRGAAVFPERAQKELRGKGARSFTVFGLRLGKRIQCLITEERRKRGT